MSVLFSGVREWPNEALVALRYFLLSDVSTDEFCVFLVGFGVCLEAVCLVTVNLLDVSPCTVILSEFGFSA